MINDVFPLVILIMLCGVPFSMLVFFTTTNSRPPRYQPLYVIMAFGMSIVWIYIIAANLVNILSALGEAWKIDKAVLAVTVLSWGNSLGDMISDIVVARQGYPSMAVGAIFGGCMMNLLLGLGIAITFSRIIPKVVPGLCFPVKPDPIVSVSFLFLMASLIMSLIVIPVCRFRSRRPYGVVLILMYVCYMIMSLLAALQPDVKAAFTWKVGRGC
jgi:sodium/potassium/calcium exchanger 6